MYRSHPVSTLQHSLLTLQLHSGPLSLLLFRMHWAKRPQGRVLDQEDKLRLKTCTTVQLSLRALTSLPDSGALLSRLILGWKFKNPGRVDLGVCPTRFPFQSIDCVHVEAWIDSTKREKIAFKSPAAETSVGAESGVDCL